MASIIDSQLFCGVFLYIQYDSAFRHFASKLLNKDFRDLPSFDLLAHFLADLFSKLALSLTFRRLDFTIFAACLVT